MLFKEKFTHCPTCGSTLFEPFDFKSKRCHKCGFTYYLNASAAVVAFIFNEEGELLVCRRGKEPAKGTLDLPGGFVDYNESAEEAIAREIKEETGMQVLTSRYLFSLPNQYLYSDLQIPTLDMFFSCTVASTANLLANDDVAECFFVPLNDIDPKKFGLHSIRQAMEKIWMETAK